MDRLLASRHWDSMIGAIAIGCGLILVVFFVVGMAVTLAHIADWVH